MLLIDDDSTGSLPKTIDQNTATALAAGTLQTTPRDDDPLLLELASNHVIGHVAVLIARVSAGMTLGWRRGGLRASSWPYRREQTIITDIPEMREIGATAGERRTQDRIATKASAKP